MSSEPERPRKSGLHPRNRHAAGYDFAALVRSWAPLARFVHPNPAGSATIDFADPAAVLALNQALLRHDYGVGHWELPPGYLCPPIPGRADYVHHLADLLGEENGGVPPRGAATVVLDIGVGANIVYPIVGGREYGWRFVGTEVDPTAITWARRLVAMNPTLAGRVELRPQRAKTQIFSGVVAPGERFAASMCNPPFHRSAAEAAAGTQRKRRNLGGGARTPLVRNFGGRSHELWCPGGEVGFVSRMIAESAQQPDRCGWFTTLVSSRESLPAIERALRTVQPARVRIIAMAQGQKRSRIVAWSFG
ncbi:MAG: 23S rRNA (adenine(1618)-N(6))-methyltransferase RlmF [Opitutaceae bacterium]|nr:23S rRNA (adenine(1618)-N(6))-methyltransferase RlmF [Opitutaceae bacterium]